MNFFKSDRKHYIDIQHVKNHKDSTKTSKKFEISTMGAYKGHPSPTINLVQILMFYLMTKWGLTMKNPN